MPHRRPRKAEILNTMDSVRALFGLRPVAEYSDEAIAEALMATAIHDPEFWFQPDHISAAWKRLNAPLRTCVLCERPIKPDEESVTIPQNQPAHWACVDEALADSDEAG